MSSERVSAVSPAMNAPPAVTTKRIATTSIACIGRRTISASACQQQTRERQHSEQGQGEPHHEPTGTNASIFTCFVPRQSDLGRRSDDSKARCNGHEAYEQRALDVDDPPSHALQRERQRRSAAQVERVSARECPTGFEGS